MDDLVTTISATFGERVSYNFTSNNQSGILLLSLYFKLILGVSMESFALLGYLLCPIWICQGGSGCGHVARGNEKIR